MTNIHLRKRNKDYLLLGGLIVFGIVALTLFFFFTEKVAPRASIKIQTLPTRILSSVSPSVAKKSSNQRNIEVVAIIPTEPPDNQSIANSPTPSPFTQPTIKQYEVMLSINGDSAFSVALPAGSNQCDVLTKALEQRKISSLNMRYDEAYKTYGVYQINGVGKENLVWWVYTVNGKSPSRGCSHIKVINEDNIEWKYIGS